MSNKEFIDSILEGVDDVRWPLKLPATLNVGDQLLSTGEVWFSKNDYAKADFVPTSGNAPETFPLNGGILILKDRAERLRASQLQKHSGLLRNRLHFYYEVVSA